jgi:RNA polymerase sigma-70 factor (ECF subfamily)
VERYQSMLANLGHRMGVPREDLEDLTAEIFLRIYKNLGSYDPTRPLFPWLYSVALNRIHDHQRALARQPQRLEASELRPVEAQSRSILEREHVRAGLQKLPERYRRVLVLHYLEDLSVAEIASILGQAEGSVKVQLLRGRRRLRRILEP